MGDSGLSFYTKAMFFQHRYGNKDLKNPIKPTFTLREYDHDGCYSFYKLFMAFDSDYEAATGILGSWRHFQILSEVSWFKEKLEQWREEREIRDRAKAKATILTEVGNGNVRAAVALQDLYKNQGAGRPSRKAKEAEARKAAGIESKVSNILDRMTQRQDG
jgi:hypothetical protein